MESRFEARRFEYICENETRFTLLRWAIMRPPPTSTTAAGDHDDVSETGSVDATDWCRGRYAADRLRSEDAIRRLQDEVGRCGRHG